MITMGIHRVSSVSVERVERRGSEHCTDHDVYQIVVHAEDGERVELTLFAEAGADIGLGPMVGDLAPSDTDKASLDDTEMPAGAW